MVEKNQNEIDDFLSNLKLKLHSFRFNRTQAELCWEQCKSEHIPHHYTPNDDANMRKLRGLSAEQYNAAMRIVDIVDMFFEPDEKKHFDATILVED